MGIREYSFATGALREGRFMRVFVLFVAFSCFGLAGLGLIVQFNPAGPVGVLDRTVQSVVLMTAVPVGVWWLRVGWPGYRAAVAFTVWADLAVAICAVTMSTPAAKLSTTIYMGIVGIFAGFLLGTRILFAHCLFGAALIATVTAVASMRDSSAVFGLFVYYMPALSWVVIVPLAGCVMIELGRRAIRRTARSAHYDPLTGLRNRRGLYAAVQARAGSCDVVAMAVCDIDQFKRLNDAAGHAAGDAALVAAADKLKTAASTDEVTARLGGDELVLVAFLEGAAQVAQLIDRLAPLTRVGVGVGDFTMSIGIAAVPSTREFNVDDLVARADSAMYEAKRAGGGCVVHQDPAVAPRASLAPKPSTTAAAAGRRPYLARRA